MASEAFAESKLDLPKLPEGWRWTGLREHVDPSRGICYGIVQPGRHDIDGVPMVNTGDVLDGNVAGRVAFKVSRELHSKFRRSVLRGGELLVTLVGANFGRVAVAPTSYAGFNCSRAVGVVPVLADVAYLMFALRSPIARHLMDTWANTTAQPTFNLKDLGNLPIPMPPPGERAEISATLLALDDSIDLLRQTNVTLEAIAQTLFKSWFVDFDPVRAKAEGHEPEGMDADTAALFPSEFEESELGLIPRGWRAGTLGDLSDLNASKWTKKKHPDWLSYIDLSGVNENRIDPPTEYRFDDAPSRARHNLRDGDTIIGTVRPGNRAFAFISEPATTLTGSTGFAVLSPRSPQLSSFVYLAATRGEAIERLANLADGGAYPAVRPSVVTATPCVVPRPEILKTFSDITQPLLNRIARNESNSRTLSEIRNTILPRLISGKLRLPEAGAVVEEAAA